MQRKVGDRENPGILPVDYQTTGIQELTEDNFEITKSCYPGFNLQRVYKEKWGHVPRTWTTVKQMIWPTNTLITIAPTPVNAWSFDEVLEFIWEAKVHYSKVSYIANIIASVSE